MLIYDGAVSDEAFVYSYMFIDDLSFIQKPEVLGFPDLNDTIEHVRARFLDAGWEGDGDIGVFWLPPFVLSEADDHYGVLVWHVKQRNDGISWLLSPIPLPLKPLLEQNEMGRLIPIGLVEQETQEFVAYIDGEMQLLHDQLALVRSMPASDQRQALEHDLVVFRHGQMVMHYHDFLDSCFLNLIRKVIEDGSTEITEIKLRGAVKLQLSLPVSMVPNDDEEAAFLTRIQITQSIWDWYRMAAFKDKVDMLFGSVGFQLEAALKQTVLRHVHLRNCIQHHGGKLTADVLQKLGATKVEIATANKPIILKAWNQIVLTEEEIILLHSALKQVAQTFDQFVNENVKARAYKRPSS